MHTFVLLLFVSLAGCGGDRKNMEPPKPGGASGGSSGAGGAAGETGGAGGSGGEDEPAAGEGGASGGSGGTGGGGGSEGPFDLSGLIETSGHHVVFHSSDPDRRDDKQIFAIDLESNEIHALLEGTTQIDSVVVSPDRRTLLLSNTDAASPSGMFVVRSVASGVVPVAPVSGFEGRSASYELQGWTGDGRFAIYARHIDLFGQGFGGVAGTYVVDAWRNALHGMIDADPEHTYASAWVSPAGEWLAFEFRGQPFPLHGGLARITDEGLETEKVEAFGLVGFSPEGNRAVYAERSNTADPAFFQRDLPSGAPMALEAQPFEDFELARMVGFSVDRDHVIAEYRDAADQHGVWRRLDLTSGESTALHEGEHKGAALYPFAAGTQILFVQGVETGFTVSLVDPTGERPFETIETFAAGQAPGSRFGALGARHAYYGAASIGIKLVARDDAGAVQRANVLEVSEDTHLCGSAQWKLPAQRAAFSMQDGASVALIDHSEPLARLAATLEPRHDGRLACPVWNESGDALAITESLSDGGESHSWIYVVRWPAGGDPEAPHLVHEADAMLDVLLARP